MSLPHISIPKIPCLLSNHHKHPFEYICMNKQCLQFNQNPLCFYCLKQSHSQHKSHTLSLKQFMSQCWKITEKRSIYFNNLTNEQHQQFYQLENILLEGFTKCKTKKQMTAVLEQIYKATYMTAKFSDLAGKRIEKVINHEIKQIRNETSQFYMTERNHHSEQRSYASLTNTTQFSIPILSFSTSLPSSQNYAISSPFHISHLKSNIISSITAHPSLSTFCESIQIFVKILRLTPNWMGIGICIGEHKYEENSKNHITLLSNGWINQRGDMRKVKHMMYEAGHLVKIQWNKEKKLLVFRNLNTKHEEIMTFEPEWNQDVFFCSTMFFKNDSIALIQSGEQ